MAKQLIVSIGREFGSGGHEIAQKLADKYELPLYDRNLLKEAALKHNLTEDEWLELEEYDEKERGFFLAKTVKGFGSSPEYIVAKMQFEYLKELAEEGQSFVVVGRCSDFILRDHPNAVSVFIHANDLAKIERVMRIYDLEEPDAEEEMKRMDRKRREYHDSYCKTDWGSVSSYDLSIDSSHLGVDGTVEMLYRYIEARRERM